MKKFKLSVKLIGGFVFVALLTLGVGFIGWRSVGQLDNYISNLSQVQIPSVRDLLIIQRELESLRVAQRTLLNPNLNHADRQRQFANVERVRENYKKAWEAYAGLPKSPEAVQLWQQLEPAVAAWKKVNDEFFRLVAELDKTGILNPLDLKGALEGFRGDHLKLQTLALAAINSGKTFSGGDDHRLCRLGKWMAGSKTDNPEINKNLEENKPKHEAFHNGIKKMQDLLKDGNTMGATALYEQQLAPALTEIYSHLGAIIQEADKAAAIYDQMSALALGEVVQKQQVALVLLAKLVEVDLAEVDKVEKQSTSEAAWARGLSLTGTGLGFGLALVLGVVLSLSITRPIGRIINALNEGADQVASASGQVSSASQQLAQGSSEQAASLEETSSSMEEMASMTRANADNANQANGLMMETGRVVEEANSAMSDLTRSMQEISNASNETAKIIKTIDEIAFQTNLLALNAAVEAARAGEAGAGFAVVADEVRNLAMRAAEAAKNTADLIESTVSRIKDGTSLVHNTNEAFIQVTQSTGRVKDLVAEIAAASTEQAQGVEQINRAVGEMDKVVQANAANAEESASASEQLSAQSEQMKGLVADLVSLVGGSHHQDGSSSGHRRQGMPASGRSLVHRRLLGPAAQGAKSSSKAPRVVPPQEVIPLDDKEFQDF